MEVDRNRIQITITNLISSVILIDIFLAWGILSYSL